ncbi:MAG: ATP-binding cassette domain-containing protein [Myxococcota bacterium]|jgi:phospholipid/cholesterol/gamma-HCH transport system ATP-binding protein|nr:ATP-binding cassette domain-containing protein [Myxococcota bacterium]
MSEHHKPQDVSDDADPVLVQGLVARYGSQTVLDGVDFAAPRGLITVILGGSGCGKSTLLRHALGLMEPEAGTVRLLGCDLFSLNDDELRSVRSRIGVLFQSGALFSSLTVGENVALVIREQSQLPEPVVRQMVRMKLALVGLENAVTKYPEELSGGMRKRAALARAMAMDPEVLMCDEPSAGLDPIVAAGLDELLLDLKAQFGMTIVVVTHELESVRKIADRVVMLEAGRVLASGTIDEVRDSREQVVRDFFSRTPRAAAGRGASLWTASRGGAQ